MSLFFITFIYMQENLDQNELNKAYITAKSRTVEEIRQTINFYIELNHVEKTIEELKEELFKVLIGYTDTVYKINFTALFRARKNKNNESFTNWKELWCPPEHKIEKIGRCNDIGESIFYGSIRPETALFEIRPKLGDKITLLDSQKIGRDISIHAIAVPQLLQADVLVQEILKDYYDSPEKRDIKNRVVNDFLNEEFIRIIDERNQHHYKTTVALSKIFLIDGKTEGLMYCSVASEIGGVNIAIKKEVANEFLEPVEAYEYVVIKQYNETSFTFQLLRVCRKFTKDGDFIWESRPAELPRFQHLTSSKLM